MTQLTQSEIEELFSLAQKYPDVWMREVLGFYPWSKQREIVRSVADNERTIVVGAHGLGKTTTLASLSLWFISVFPDAFVYVTAPAYRQVRDQFFRELAKRLRFAKMRLGGSLIQGEFRLDEGQKIKGVASDKKDPDLFTGYHASHTLCVLDQGGGPEVVYDSANGAIAAGSGRIIAVSNSATPQSYFAEIYQNPDLHKGWNRIRVTAFDCPNVRAGKNIYPDLPPYDYPYRRAEEWGEDSAKYKIFILAEFVDLKKESMFSLVHLKQAFENRRELEDSDKLRLSIDVAQSGGPTGDDSIVTSIIGKSVVSIDRLHTDNVNDVARKAIERVEEYSSFHDLEFVTVDSIGAGIGVASTLRDKRLPVVMFKNSESAENFEEFKNVRAESYWHLQEILKTLDFSRIPEEERKKLREEMGATSFFFSNDKVQILAKEKIKARLGWSPDLLDTLVMGFYSKNTHVAVDLYSEKEELKKLAEESKEEFELAAKLMGIEDDDELLL